MRQEGPTEAEKRRAMRADQSGPKAPPMQGDEIELARDIGVYAATHRQHDHLDVHIAQLVMEALTAAEARGYERGMTVAAEIAQAYGIGQNISFRGLPRACEEIAAEIRHSLKREMG